MMLGRSDATLAISGAKGTKHPRMGMLVLGSTAADGDRASDYIGK